MSIYEYHDLSADVPFIFHSDTLSKDTSAFGISNWHENIEFLYCTHGSGSVFINSKKIKMHPGSVIIVNSDKVHYVAATSNELKFHCFIIDMNFLRTNGFNVDNTEFEDYINDDSACVYLDKISEEFISKDCFYTHKIKGYTLLLTAHCMQYHSHDCKKQAGSNPVKEAIEYIKHHYEEPLSVEELANHVCLSRYYFSRLFKSVAGCTVREYIQIIRCRRAEAMLMNGSCTVSEASESCGFSDVSYFAKIFKKHLGYLPSKLKNHLIE